MTLPFTLMIFDGFPCLLFPISDHGTSADRSYRHQTPNDGSQERKWGLQAAVALNILVVEVAKTVEMVKHGSIIVFSFVDFVAAAAVVAVAGAKKPCSFDRYSRTWTRNLSIVVNFTQHQNCNRLVTICYDHVFLFGLKLNRTNRLCRTETPMYISSTRVPCQCQVFSFQTCFLFILFTSQFFEPPKGTQMW